MTTAEKKEPDFPEHVHKAFEGALVSLMEYFRGVWVDKDRQIHALTKQVEELEATLTRVREVYTKQGRLGAEDD